VATTSWLILDENSFTCQQNGGNRCARSRSPRSARTVEAEGKRSLDVQLNALFAAAIQPLLPALLP
jgi:hypothetical protein